MLEQPWPPPGPGPQQPRDAHGAQWGNDARRRRVGRLTASPDGPPAEAWDDLYGRAPAARRRVVDESSERGARPGATSADPSSDAARQTPAAPAAGWVPREEWIPDPTPAPEQRWSPEQDWLSAFDAHRAQTEAQAAVSTAARVPGRWWLAAGAGLLASGTVTAIVVVLF